MNFKQYLQIISVYLILLTALSAETVEINGIGESYPQAIQNALVEALKQRKDSKSSQIAAIKQIFAENDTPNQTQKRGLKRKQQQQEITAEIAQDDNEMLAYFSGESVQQAVQQASQNIIQSFTVIDSNEDQAEWQVLLEIQLAKKPQPRKTARLKKIAVIPFRIKQSNINVSKQKLKAYALSRQLNQKIVAELTKSRRFKLIDREYIEDYLTEINFILSDNVSIKEQSKIGKALAADYLLLGTINKLNISEQQQNISFLAGNMSTMKARMTVDFRLLVMSTRAVKWADTVKINANNQDLKMAKKAGLQAVVDYLTAQVAETMIQGTLNALYPLKVLKVKNKRVIYLNQGGKAVEVGQKYAIFAPAEKMIDPDTGLEIVLDGEEVATVKITRVKAKYSIAKFSRGNFKAIEKGAGMMLKSSSRQHKQQKTQKVMQPSW